MLYRCILLKGSTTVNSLVKRIIQNALEEDIGLGDVTTEATVPLDQSGSAELVAKEDFRLAGIDVAAEVFAQIDESVSFEKLKVDGEKVRRGDVIAWVKGPAASLLKAERVALNFLQRLSGVATLTEAFVNKVADTGVRIVDTRKTTPGLRILEKYAVRMGGGHNHRIGLFDGVLIKENHIAAVGSIEVAVKNARMRIPHTIRIEVETQNIDEVKQAVDAQTDIIMLDNMSLPEITEAIALIDKRAIIEVSGGVNLETVRELAETGVDIISVGALTHSHRSVDISMLFV